MSRVKFARAESLYSYHHTEPVHFPLFGVERLYTSQRIKTYVNLALAKASGHCGGEVPCSKDAVISGVGVANYINGQLKVAGHF